MIRTRLLATAFLIHGDRLLMMQRSPASRFFPGMWAPVGGHIEAGELNDPLAACRREIFEETGLGDDDLLDLSLRYIMHRRRGNEIRIQYMYFGHTAGTRVGATDEGELHWVSLDAAAELNVSATTRFALAHYTRIGAGTEWVYVGTVDAEDGRPAVTWARLRDWE